MKIIISVEKGEKKVNVYSDGCEIAIHDASRTLTGGTACDSLYGVFCYTKAERVKFWVGDYSKIFDFTALDLFERGKERTNLMERIRIVREWADSIDYTIEFEI